jgi:hypothetical protein
VGTVAMLRQHKRGRTLGGAGDVDTWGRGGGATAVAPRNRGRPRRDKEKERGRKWARLTKPKSPYRASPPVMTALSRHSSRPTVRNANIGQT